MRHGRELDINGIGYGGMVVLIDARSVDPTGFLVHVANCLETIVPRPWIVLFVAFNVDRVECFLSFPDLSLDFVPVEA